MRIVIVGMGVAGGVIAAGLADLPGMELACVEQVDRDGLIYVSGNLPLAPGWTARPPPPPVPLLPCLLRQRLRSHIRHPRRALWGCFAS